MPDWQRWQDEIATTIANSTTIQDAAANLGLWAKRAAEDESIAGGIYSAAMQADLAGQLFVRQVEVPESMPERALADKSAAAFFSLPFDEAVQEFLSKRIVTPEEFRRLSDAARTRAFTATYLASDGLREHAFELLAKALQEGSTLRDFAAQLQAGEVSLGVTPSSPAYIETVYRTNIQSAYGAGRYRQITNPVVVAARPYIEYRTAQDSRVRPSHALLDGVIFEQSDPNWSRYAPPNGYNCFSAGTLVQGKAVAALRAWYAGELVELTTESGRRLTVTPNHPLATCNGFVPAGSIREGEEVFAYRDGVDGSLVGGVDPQDAPVKIEEVFDALAVRNGPAARLRPVSDDLHGDAKFVHGDVDVVAAHGVLLLHRNTEPGADRRDGVFASTLSGLVSEVARGGTSDLGIATNTALGGSMSASDLRAPALVGHEGPLDPLCVGLASSNDARLSQPAGDDRSADAAFIRDLILRAPGDVSLDQVISVRRFDFSGHVYDLQTVGGWQVASGIVASNCRCGIVTLRARDVDRSRVVASSDLPADTLPDSGFDTAPTVTLNP